MSEVQEVIYEVVEELRKMTAPEIKKFQKNGWKNWKDVAVHPIV